MSSPEGVGFAEFPGILLIRLMSRCNERCLFCMVADEIARSDDLEYQTASKRILEQPDGTLIEFFGGEPTIYPRFLDLLRVARSAGHPCSIATNMRIFHSRRFTDSVSALGAGDIYVRTSLYGRDAELHDYYTAAPGSYVQTVKGIENVVGAGFPNQVNIVILERNYRQLSDIARQVAGWGVKRIKFGNLIHIATCAPHAVPLSSVKPYLLEAIDIAESLGLAVTVEKTPICMTGGRIDLLSTERKIYGSDRAFDDGGACAECLVRRWCDGWDRDYTKRFGFDGIEPVSEIPLRAARPIDPTFEPELLKMHCVAVEDAELDERTTEQLTHILARVVARHGDLAIFPRKFLRETN